MTHLSFIGKAVAVKVNMPKGNSYGSEDDAGSVDVTFRIEAPKRPRDPAKQRYDWQTDNLRERCAGERPKDKKEAAAWDQAKKDLDTRLARYAREDEEYQAGMAAVAAATLAYAQLAGICVVFSNQRLNVILSPADQDLLPGMGVSALLADSQLAVANHQAALAKASADVEALPDPDDDDFDGEDA